jgi:hypothetical protein
VQVKYLQEGVRVHKTELEWQAMNLKHQADLDMENLRSRHQEAQQALQAQMDDLTYAFPPITVCGNPHCFACRFLVCALGALPDGVDIGGSSL